MALALRLGIAQQTAHTNYRNYNATRADCKCVCVWCVCAVCVCVCLCVVVDSRIGARWNCTSIYVLHNRNIYKEIHTDSHTDIHNTHTQHTYTHRNIYTNTHTFMQIETHTHSQGTLTQIAAKLITKCARVFNVSKLLLPLSFFLYLPLCLYPCTSPFPCLFFFFYFLQYANGKCQQAKQSSKRPLEMKWAKLGAHFFFFFLHICLSRWPLCLLSQCHAHLPLLVRPTACSCELVHSAQSSSKLLPRTV